MAELAIRPPRSSADDAGILKASLRMRKPSPGPLRRTSCHSPSGMPAPSPWIGRVRSRRRCPSPRSRHSGPGRDRHGRRPRAGCSPASGPRGGLRPRQGHVGQQRRSAPSFRRPCQAYIRDRSWPHVRTAHGRRKGRGREKRSRQMNYFKTMLLLAALTALFMGVGYLLGGSGGMMIAFLFALATNAWAFWNSDKVVLRMHDAQPVTRASMPEFYDMVARLARNADQPMPKVYIIQADQPNAFATGRNPENAAVAATTGLLKLLTPAEVAGVMAHELAHVKNRDTLIMTIAATVAGAIAMLAQFGFLFGGR